MKTMPEQYGTHPHDMAIGPCACGATHKLSDWPEEVQVVIAAMPDTPPPPAPDTHPREEAMLPCPFCDNPSVELDGGSVECRVCGAMGPDDTRRGSDPVAAWNSRTPTPAVAEGVSDTELLDWLDKLWPLKIDHPDDREEEGVQIKTIRGNVNDRIWTTVAQEPTLRAAILSALRTGGPGK